MKTDLSVLCSSSLFKFCVQFFCSSIVFKILKTFAQVKSNYMIKEFSLLFLNSLNLKTELVSCKILFQSNLLLQKFSLLFFNFLNLKTDLSVLCSSPLFKFFVQFFCSSIVFKILKTFVQVKSNYMIKDFSLLFFNFLNLKTFQCCVQVLCSSFLLFFFVQVLCSKSWKPLLK